VSEEAHPWPLCLKILSNQVLNMVEKDARKVKMQTTSGMRNCVLVKMCGDCNPQIRMKRLLKQLEIETERYTFITNPEEKCRLLLIINGCMSDCVRPPEFDGHIIIVSGLKVDYVDCIEKEMVQRIFTLLDRYSDG